MNLEEAKNLLQLCRPGHPEDLEDPAIAEAFALCQKHPELREWFETQQAFDHTVAQSIDSIEVPADLKASILAGMRIHEANSPEDTSQEVESERVHREARNWWKNPWVGIAAVFALLLSIVLFPREDAEQVATTTTDQAVDQNPAVLNYLEHEIEQIRMFTFDKQGENPDELRTFLASHSAPSPERLPTSIEGLNSIGCLMLDYKGTKMSIICFKGKSVYHLVTAERQGFPLEVSSTPQIFELQNLSFKLWSEGDKVQMLAVQGSKQNLPELI